METSDSSSKDSWLEEFKKTVEEKGIEQKYYSCPHCQRYCPCCGRPYYDQWTYPSTPWITW